MDVFGCAGKLVRVSSGGRLQRRRAEKTDIALPPGGVRRVRHRRRRGVREPPFRKGGLPDLLPPEARRYEMSTPPIILIVDDDSSHRAMLRTVLRGGGMPRMRPTTGIPPWRKSRSGLTTPCFRMCAWPAWTAFLPSGKFCIITPRFRSWS